MGKSEEQKPTRVIVWRNSDDDHYHVDVKYEHIALKSGRIPIIMLSFDVLISGRANGFQKCSALVGIRPLSTKDYNPLFVSVIRFSIPHVNYVHENKTRR